MLWELKMMEEQALRIFFHGVNAEPSIGNRSKKILYTKYATDTIQPIALGLLAYFYYQSVKKEIEKHQRDQREVREILQFLEKIESTGEAINRELESFDKQRTDEDRAEKLLERAMDAFERSEGRVPDECDGQSMKLLAYRKIFGDEYGADALDTAQCNEGS